VCIAVTGKSTFDAPFGSESDPTTRLFASALITLCYSHAAWFVEDVNRAMTLAKDAASRFAALGFRRYASRAENLARLLSIWEDLSKGNEPDFSFLRPDLTRLLRILIGRDSDERWLAENFPVLRPSTAIGLLQFYRQFKSHDLAIQGLKLPATIASNDNGNFVWRSEQVILSLDEGERELRRCLGIPVHLRVPLMAD
jgi:hypothetical protein